MAGNRQWHGKVAQTTSGIAHIHATLNNTTAMTMMHGNAIASHAWLKGSSHHTICRLNGLEAAAKSAQEQWS